MRKRLFAFIFTAAISAAINISAAQAQSSQAIQVDIPFAFTTNNGTLPAGTYRIESAGDNRALWRIRPTDHKPGEFLLATTLRGGGTQGELGLTFHRYGDSYFLAKFKTPSYEVALPAPKSERVLRSTSVPVAQIEVIGIKTASGGSH